MPHIVCGAKNCAYNRENTCGLPDVHVAGQTAKKPAGTCCADFCTDPRCVAPHPSEFARVECAAELCRHNANGKCDAGCIDIGGRRAECSEDTECDTFIRKS